MLINIRKGVPHLKRDIKLHQPLRIRTCTLIRPIKHCNLIWRYPACKTLLHLFNQIQGLMLLPGKLPDVDLPLPFTYMHGAFGKAFCILTDHKLCGTDDRSNRTEIPVEHDLLRIRIVLRKIQHNLRLRPPETID